MRARRHLNVGGRRKDEILRGGPTQLGLEYLSGHESRAVERRGLVPGSVMAVMYLVITVLMLLVMTMVLVIDRGAFLRLPLSTAGLRFLCL